MATAGPRPALLPHLIELNDMIRTAAELEPLPASTTRLAHLLAAAEWDLQAVTQAIALDPPLTGKLLRIANSVVLGGRQRVASIDAACVRLGPGAILSLAIGCSMRSQLNAALPEYDLDEGQLWRHSVAAALAAERMGKHCEQAIPPETFAAALLHDIGKLVLARHLDQRTLNLIRFAMTERNMDRLEAESAILTIHHAQIGGIVAQHWQLPSNMVRAITYHHAPQDAPIRGNEQVCYAVRLADLVAHAISEKASERELSLADRIGVGQNLRLKPRAFASLCAEVEESLDEVLHTYATATAVAA
jgi:HD-like signal output (HDOD) protein